MSDATFMLNCTGQCWGTGHAFKLVKGKCAHGDDLERIMIAIIVEAESTAKQNADADCAYRASGHKECVCRGDFKRRDVGSKVYKADDCGDVCLYWAFATYEGECRR